MVLESMAQLEKNKEIVRRFNLEVIQNCNEYLPRTYACRFYQSHRSWPIQWCERNVEYFSDFAHGTKVCI